MRVKITLIAIFLFVILLTSLISAEIMLSQPKLVYSAGDEFNISASLKQTTDSDGFLELNLVCGSESRNFHRQYVSLEKNQEKVIRARVLFNKDFSGEMAGTCNAKATYLDNEAVSQNFEISHGIDATLNANSLDFFPSETVFVKGSAIKANSELLDGFIELQLEDLKSTGSVKAGKFEAELLLPENIKTGSYTLQAEVYEKDKNDDIINTGTASTTIQIKPVETKLNIVLEKQNFKPGENLSFIVEITDQGGEKMEGQIGVSVLDSGEQIYLKKLVKSEEKVSVYLEKNLTPSSWKILATTPKLTEERLFFIEENEEASFEIVDNVLTIRNIGNVLYKKIVEVLVGDENEMLNVSLDLNGEQKFKIEGPEGSHKIIVRDDNKSITKEAYLTGPTTMAISVKEVKRGVVKRYSIIWIFLIALFSFSAIMLARKTYKKKSIAYGDGSVSTGDKTKMSLKDKIKKDIKKMEDYIHPVSNVKEAEHSIVTNGVKQDSAVIAIRIENFDKVKDKGAIKETIEELRKIASENKGAVYLSDKYLIMLFSPLITKTFKNETPAVRIASEIAEKLKDHNKRFQDKIEFGIGLNTGEIIAEKKDNKLRFTSLGNTLPLAKKIADLSSSEVLLSGSVHSKVIPEIKTEKEDKQGISVYHIKYVAEREKYSQFIRDFLNRQKAESFVK